MNCQDISRVLDSRDVNAFSTGERRACEAHAASCPHCGPEWVVYTHLAAMTAPSMPQEFAARCEALAAAQPGKGGGLSAGRKLLLGVFFLVAGGATAAVMLGIPQRIAEAVAPAPAAEDAVSSLAAAAGAAPAEKVSVLPAPGDFTVHLRSLQHESPDANAQRLVQEYHALLADGLRAVPGLKLLDDQAAAKADAPASFRVTIGNPDATAAQQALSGGQWAATLRVEVLKQGSGASGSAGAVYVPAEGHTRGGVYGPEPFASKTVVAPLSGNCPRLILCSPARIVEWQIKDLRVQVFPLDGSIQQDLETQLLDSALSIGDHMQALNDLQSVTNKAGTAMDAAVVREVLERIAGLQDEGDRSVYWGFLRGQRHPQMVQPLIEIARRDPADGARLEAVLQLGADFPEDAAVRAALQAIARDDSAMLNRKLAERALLGDGPWNDYVVATMEDSTQPVQGRLEPLHRMIIEGMPVTPLAGALFGENKQVFIDLLVQADKRFATRALGAIGSVKHPEAAGFVLAVFDAAPDYSRLLLLKEHLNDPRVRARVEKVAADPSDPTLQATASGMLGQLPGN
jgi:hypothetical protein